MKLYLKPLVEVFCLILIEGFFPLVMGVAVVRQCGTGMEVSPRARLWIIEKMPSQRVACEDQMESLINKGDLY